MRNTILGSIVAGGLALSSATPVAATTNEERLGQFLFGAMALFVLKEALDNKKDTKTVRPAPAPEPVEPVINRPHRKVLPAHCLKRVKTRKGPVRMFGKRCLENNYRFTHRLPKACKIKTRTVRDRIRKGYKPHCLRKHGYRMSSH